PDEGFRVTDRRRRDTIEAPGASSAPSPPRPAATFSPEGLHDAPDPRNLVGLFVMLATAAVIALGEAPDPATGPRQRELPPAAARSRFARARRRSARWAAPAIPPARPPRTPRAATRSGGGRAIRCPRC